MADQEVLYTLGMRGVHDGKMQGAKTVEEQKAVLDRVLADQRGLIKKYVNKDVTQVPQVFIPYKEVLDIYNAGLQVPEDDPEYYFYYWDLILLSSDTGFEDSYTPLAIFMPATTEETEQTTRT